MIVDTSAIIAVLRDERHPALNVGECFTYALARERDDTLLFKGDDFGHTDVIAASSSG